MTPNKTQLLALAEQVERFNLSGPFDIARQRESELNEAIARAVGVPCTVEVGHEALGNYRKVPARVPAYTASLDAATTLIPKGMGFHLNRYWSASHDGPVWSCEITTGGTPDRPRQVFECFDAPSPAIAAAAAALRALAAGCGDNSN